jgi:hypothetical protein
VAVPVLTARPERTPAIVVAVLAAVADFVRAYPCGPMILLLLLLVDGAAAWLMRGGRRFFRWVALGPLRWGACHGTDTISLLTPW